MLQMLETMHKGKCPSQISKGLLGASSFGTVAVVNFIQILPTKKIERRIKNSIRSFRMFRLLSFHGLKHLLVMRGR